MRPKKVLMAASVASMIDQFNMPNIRLLQDMGYEVHVACNLKEGNTCDEERLRTFQETLRRMRVVLHQWDCPRSVFAVRACAAAFRQMMALTGKHQYAWIHCHSPIGGALVRAAAHCRGIRVIYTAHGFHFYQGAPLKNWLLYYPAEKLLARWTDVLVTVNREDHRLAKKKMHAGKVCYIPGVGIDTERFCGAGCTKQERAAFCRRYRIPGNAVLLLSVGELNKGKNHEVVLKALARLARTDVYYVIVGQGTLQGHLQKLAEQLGIARQVRLAGYQQDISWYYQNADIFVFPSKREGMPVALLEAMAAGMPCVVSNIRGNRELIFGRKLNQAGGRCFSWKHSQELADVLSEILLNKPMWRECGKRNQIQTKAYDWMFVRKRMQRVYAEVSMKGYSNSLDSFDQNRTLMRRKGNAWVENKDTGFFEISKFAGKSGIQGY